MTNTELKQIRESLSLSKAQLAEKLGITNMLLGRYEKGSCAIPEKVEKALNRLTAAAAEAEKKAGEGDIPSLIKNIRESLSLNKSAFARMIGVTPAMIGSYESGKYKPKEEILRKIKELNPSSVEEKQADAQVEENAPVQAEEKAPAQIAEEAPAQVKEKIAAPTEEKQKAVSGRKKTAVFIQSLMGGSITPEEILARIPEGAEKVYVKPEENAAYWTKGDESGSVALW